MADKMKIQDRITELEQLLKMIKEKLDSTSGLLMIGELQ